MSISACLIAKDEEAWIGDCIENIKPICKEIIVVDTGSKDRTMEIAREKGARVSQIKWENDFAKARNASLDKATQRWILIIDPDERIAGRDLEKIVKLTEESSAMAYSFNARNYSENAQASGFKPCTGEYADEERGQSGFFESRKVRLFQNTPNIRFQGTVHELVESSITGKVVESEIPFHHYGSTKQVVVQKNKKELYRKQADKKISEEPNNWKAHFEKGVELLGSSDFREAAVSLEKARDLNPGQALVLSNLGFAYMESGKFDQAEQTLKACLKIEPSNHDAYLNWGVTEMRRKKYEEALKVFDQLIRIHPQSFMGFRNAGNCFARLKNLNQAAACFQQALKIFPDFNEARIDLAVVCYAGGKLDVSQKILDEALKRDPYSLRAQALKDEIAKLKTAQKA